jgi:hypothetical protein
MPTNKAEAEEFLTALEEFYQGHRNCCVGCGRETTYLLSNAARPPHKPDCKLMKLKAHIAKLEQS